MIKEYQLSTLIHNHDYNHLPDNTNVNTTAKYHDQYCDQTSNPLVKVTFTVFLAILSLYKDK